MKIVCIGHSTYDITLPVTIYPKENKKYRTDQLIECAGGSASNGAYLLNQWGADVAFYTAIGNDYFGEKIINDFKIAGMDTSHIEIIPNHKTSSSYIIANTEKGTRTIITSKGENLKKLKEKVEIEPDFILTDGEHYETVIETLEKYKNAISILDAGRLSETNKKIGKMVTYLICSKDFAEDFAEASIDSNNIDSIVYCYNKLKKYFNTNIVITLEDKGSFTEIENKYEIIKSLSVKAIDSTGAGDIFHAAFTYFLSKNYSLKESLHYASIAGALSVKYIGTRNSMPSIKEVFDNDFPI